MTSSVRRRVSSHRLVGRDDELDAVLAWARALHAGEPSAVLVSGRAGMGKSRLVEELGRRLAAERARVVAGGCLPLEAGGPPYIAIRAALTEVVAEDAPVMRALGGTDDVGRPGLFDLVGSCLADLSRNEPLVVVVEDVHWSDRATRDLLLYLVSQVRRGAWGLVVTVRYEGPLTIPQLGEFCDALGQALALRIDLGTLAEQDVAAMASDITGQVPTGDELRLLTRRSGGIPLLVEELLAAGDSGVPVHLRALFLHRVGQLGPEVTAIVQTSAVVGEACDDELLGAVSGSSLDRTRELVDAGCRQDILVRGAGGVALRHELLREVVYDALSSDTRRRLHHRVAQELEARGETRPAKLAHHWHNAGEPERSGPASLAAAAQADAVHAPAAAHQHLERVLETWEHLPASVQEAAGGRGDVLRRAAQAAERAGSFARAAVLAEQRLRLEVGGADERALRLERLARYRWESGDAEAAASAYRAAVYCLEPGTPSGVRAKVLSGQAWFLGAALELAEARAVSQTALEAVTPETDAAVRWQVLLAWGVARLDEEAGYQALCQARDLAVGLDAGYNVAITNLWINNSLQQLGRTAERESVLRYGETFAAAHGLGRGVTDSARFMLAELMLETARWDDAEAVLAEIREAEGMPAYFAAGFRARLASWRGDQAVLTLACRDAAAQGERAGRQPLPMAISLVAQAEALLWAGEAERGLELAIRATDLAHADGYYRAVCLAARARAAADVADAARRHGRAVEVSAADLLELASRTSAPERAAVHAYQATALAEVERLQGSRDATAWRVAVAAWSRTEDTYQAACAELRLLARHSSSPTSRASRSTAHPATGSGGCSTPMRTPWP
jgi:hypothetical protein